MSCTITDCATDKRYCAHCLPRRDAHPEPVAVARKADALAAEPAGPASLEAALTRTLRVTAEDGLRRRNETFRLIAGSPRLRQYLEMLAAVAGDESLRPCHIEALPEYQALLREHPGQLTPREQKLEAQIAIFLEALLRALPPGGVCQ